MRILYVGKKFTIDFKIEFKSMKEHFKLFVTSELLSLSPDNNGPC